MRPAAASARRRARTHRRARGAHHRNRTFFGQPHRDRGADARRAAGHDHDLVSQIQIHFASPSFMLSARSTRVSRGTGTAPAIRASSRSRNRAPSAACTPRRARHGSTKCSCGDRRTPSRALLRAGNADVIDHRQMLHVLAQPDAARMRAHGQPYFAAISITARISFTPPSRHASICATSIAPRAMNCEQHAVLAHLAGRDLHGRDRLPILRCPRRRRGWSAPR